jgi:hypothetical protein
VSPWLDLVRKVYPDEADHIVRWLAHRRQRPAEKINHALVLGGKVGIGKDTILAPARYAVGPWNCQSVSPLETLGSFTGYRRAIILHINEARDLGEFDRFAFHDHTKILITAPPDVLRVNEKHLKEFYIPNVCGVVITTNHKADGIYLPADDRRHFVAWSDLDMNAFEPGYWKTIYSWYDSGGYQHVAEYLDSVDLQDFDAKAPLTKTAAFWEIVHASSAPEDAELADAIDALGERAGANDAITLYQIAANASTSLDEYLRDRRNSRRIPFRLEACGYVAVRNENAKDGLWRLQGRRQVIYAKADLSPRDRIVALRKAFPDIR